jgi:translation initiation factor IF-1
MSKEETVNADGIVLDFCHDIFKVEIEEDVIVTCRLSGRIRKNSIKILLGDSVTVEMSSYDLTKGRIIYRNKK